MIFDSCIWVGLAAGEIDPEAVTGVAGKTPVFASVISLGELSFGVEASSNPVQRAVRAAYFRKVNARPALTISKHTAAAFGLLAAAVKQSGRSPRPRYNDLWIAAQAIEHNYVLLTVNPDDFSGLPGLRLATVPIIPPATAPRGGEPAPPLPGRASP